MQLFEIFEKDNLKPKKKKKIKDWYSNQLSVCCLDFKQSKIQTFITYVIMQDSNKRTFSKEKKLLG